MVKHDLASVGSQHINGEKKELSCECDAFLGFLRALTDLGRALLPVETQALVLFFCACYERGFATWTFWTSVEVEVSAAVTRDSR